MTAETPSEFQRAIALSQRETAHEARTVFVEIRYWDAAGHWWVYLRRDCRAVQVVARWEWWARLRARWQLGRTAARAGAVA